MKNSRSFSIFYACLLFSTVALLIVGLNIPIVADVLQKFWQTWLVGICLSYFISGLGLSLPIAIIGLALSWLQLLLLMNNRIEPHLQDEGLGSVIREIFTQLGHWITHKTN